MELFELKQITRHAICLSVQKMIKVQCKCKVYMLKLSKILAIDNDISYTYTPLGPKLKVDNVRNKRTSISLSKGNRHY